MGLKKKVFKDFENKVGRRGTSFKRFYAEMYEKFIILSSMLIHIVNQGSPEIFLSSNFA